MSQEKPSFVRSDGQPVYGWVPRSSADNQWLEQVCKHNSQLEHQVGLALAAGKGWAVICHILLTGQPPDQAL